MDYLLSLNCSSVCACVKRVDTYGLCRLRSDCINMIDSVNGVIIPHIRQMKSFNSQIGLHTQSLKNKPNFCSCCFILFPFFLSVLAVIHIRLSLFLILLFSCRMNAGISWRCSLADKEACLCVEPMPSTHYVPTILWVRTPFCSFQYSCTCFTPVIMSVWSLIILFNVIDECLSYFPKQKPHVSTSVQLNIYCLIKVVC